jgi:hypothetical protein
MTRTLFTNVAILDGSGTAPFPGQALIEGNRIAMVAKANDRVIVDGANGLTAAAPR